MPSPFKTILEGKRKALVLFENSRFLSFLEASPLKKGHALVIPKKEIDAFFDIEDEDLKELIVFAKKVAAGIRKAVPCEKIALVVYGLKTRHAHLHLIPVDNTPGELDFSKSRPSPENELELLASQIRPLI